MRNLIFTFGILILTGCVRTIYNPYDGQKIVVGEGGFVEYIVYADQLNKPLFSEAPKYKYDMVTFYNSGLPANKKCMLVGYYAGKVDYFSLAQAVLTMEANVATKSRVSLPLRFEDKTSVVNISSDADDWYNGYGDKVMKGYNIFECQ